MGKAWAFSYIDKESNLQKSIIKGDNLWVTGPYQTMLRFHPMPNKLNMSDKEKYLWSTTLRKCHQGSKWIPMGICLPVAIKAHKGQFFHGLLVWPTVCSNSMSSHIGGIRVACLHWKAMDGPAGIKSEKAVRSPRFFKESLCGMRNFRNPKPRALAGSSTITCTSCSLSQCQEAYTVTIHRYR